MSFARFLVRAFCLAFVCLSLIRPHPAAADPLPEPWKSKREQNNAISNKACKGDRAAIAEVKRRWAASDPLMMNSAGFLKENCDPFRAMSWEKVTEYQRKSALAGYPIAMSNYGLVLLRGERGAEKDTTTAVALINRAIDAGYGRAARNLALEYAAGKHLPRDLKKARAYLKRAAAEQVSGKLLADAEARIVKAEAESAAKQATPPLPDRFAALAVSTSDAVFGFAHDHGNRGGAARRAVDECRERGGTQCDVKLLLRGPACIAYRYEPGGTVFGWGFSKAKAAADDRAAQECSKRNSNRPCAADAWVCNERSDQAIDAIVVKNLPTIVETAAGDGDSCFVKLTHVCNNFSDARDLVGRKEVSTAIVHFADFKMNSLACTQDRKGHTQLAWNWPKNKWSSTDQKTAPPDIVARSRKLLSEYRTRVRAEFPRCKANPKKGLDNTYIEIMNSDWHDMRRKDEARHKETGYKAYIYLD